ncbi:MAG: hypothetical protein PHF21_03025 [Bacilli bacterium]|nr:hypothetical protein [Bacilli bacterium]
MFKTNNRCAQMNMEFAKSEHMMPSMSLPGMECQPIIECPCERVINRQFNHCVPHIQPIHTRVINHHIYNHSYIPQYTCCEENQVIHVYDQNPCCK